MHESLRVVNAEAAWGIASGQGAEFLVIKNPSGVFPPSEVCPLAPKQTAMTDGVEAILLDMDGTLSATEGLVISALEAMVRQMTGRDEAAWPGLDPGVDYPQIVGTSNTQNVEYLLAKHRTGIRGDCVLRALLEAQFWKRGHDVELDSFASDSRLNHFPKAVWTDPRHTGMRLEDAPFVMDALVRDYGSAFSSIGPVAQARAGVELYSHAYAQFLSPPGGGEALVKAMPWVELFLFAARGFFTAVSDAMILRLGEQLNLSRHGSSPEQLLRACRSLKHPKIAVVTSSTKREADLVLRAVRAKVVARLRAWPDITESLGRIEMSVAEYVNDFSRIFDFDAVITADDSHEIRLKPHRDLYSIALDRLGIGRDRFHRVIAIEDSAAGVAAIRAAGIGMAVAVPHDATAGHDFSHASHVCAGGLVEVLGLLGEV